MPLLIKRGKVILAFACIDDGVETASGQLSYSKFLEMVGNFFK
jgi:hypothetical protein